MSVHFSNAQHPQYCHFLPGRSSLPAANQPGNIFCGNTLHPQWMSTFLTMVVGVLLSHQTNHHSKKYSSIVDAVLHVLWLYKKIKKNKNQIIKIEFFLSYLYIHCTNQTRMGMKIFSKLVLIPQNVSRIVIP